MEYYHSHRWKIQAQIRLPYHPTPIEIIHSLFEILKEEGLLEKRHKLVDLGAGDGRVILHVAEKCNIESIALTSRIMCR